MKMEIRRRGEREEGGREETGREGGRWGERREGGDGERGDGGERGRRENSGIGIYYTLRVPSHTYTCNIFTCEDDDTSLSNDIV